MNKNIIGLTGFKGSGKDTVAHILKEYDFVQFSFASTLKTILSEIFSWDQSILKGDTSESRKIREQTDEWWSEKLGIPNFTPRMALTSVGTDLFRNKFNDLIWIYSLHKKILNCNADNIVISDIRFKNEFNYVKSLNGRIFRIERFDYDWKDDAYNASLGISEAIETMKSLNIHESEYDCLSCEHDGFINNRQSYVELVNEVNNKMFYKDK